MKRVLVVDDEEALLQLLQKYLTRLGYEVDIALSAEEALPLVEREPGRYELFLIDLTLTGMPGDALAARILERDHDARILLTSGYSFDAIQLPASDLERINFLQKPFLPRQLIEMINQMSKTT